jgi:hypothetical protein
MHAFTFGKDDVRTVSTNVDITGLAGKPWSLDVYSMFTDRRFEGFTVGLVLLGVCPNGALLVARGPHDQLQYVHAVGAAL